MAVTEYKTRAGRRYQAHLWMDRRKVASRGGFATKAAARAWLADEAARRRLPATTATAFSHVLGLYLDDAMARRQRNTYIYKRSVFRKFAAHLGGDPPMPAIDRATVREFLAQAADRISPKSANKYRTEIHALFAWAQREGLYHGPNPAAGLEPYPVQRTVRYVPPAADLAALLMAAQGWERDLLLLLIHTAARISEITGLTWEDVNLEHSTLTLWTSKRRGGHREPRTMALTATALEVIRRRWTDPERHSTHVLTNPETGRPFTRQSRALKYLFPRLCAQAGITRPITAHCIRHYIATALTDAAKVDVRAAQRLLGHMNIRTTQIYLHDLAVDRSTAATIQGIADAIPTNSTIPSTITQN